MRAVYDWEQREQMRRMDRGSFPTAYCHITAVTSAVPFWIQSGVF
ncbi:MAG: hypothetical protein WB679_03835 [Terracidiphilus sp.]